MDGTIFTPCWPAGSAILNIYRERRTTAWLASCTADRACSPLRQQSSRPPTLVCHVCSGNADHETVFPRGSRRLAVPEGFWPARCAPIEVLQAAPLLRWRATVRLAVLSTKQPVSRSVWTSNGSERHQPIAKRGARLRSRSFGKRHGQELRVESLQVIVEIPPRLCHVR